MLFVTEGELKKHYYDNNLINYEKVFNDQFLIKCKINDNIEHTDKNITKSQKTNKQTPFPVILGSYILAHSR